MIKNKSSRYFCDFTAKGIIISAIIILLLVLAAIVFYSLFFTTEKQVQLKFEALAKDYYENTFYADMLKSDNYSGDPEQSLSKYKDVGLSTITLRQLILFDEEKTAQDADFLLKYCDEEKTYVRFFPEAPYESTSYQAKYTYSCNY